MLFFFQNIERGDLIFVSAASSHNLMDGSICQIMKFLAFASGKHRYLVDENQHIKVCDVYNISYMT